MTIFPQSMCSAYYCGYYSINICHSNTTNYLTQGIYLVQIRGNVHTRSAYPFVNLSVCHFSVIHKMNSSCTNLESKKRKKKKYLSNPLENTFVFYILPSGTFGKYAY